MTIKFQPIASFTEYEVKGTNEQDFSSKKENIYALVLFCFRIVK
jgi:hypothetical protein